MKKLHRARDFLAGAIVMALAVALVLPVGAALTGKTIEVLTGVDIYVDGVKMEPKDANGKSVETFVYNGTTYVPLRAVSQSLGKNVNWDGANQRVYIGEVPEEKQYLLNVCPPYQTNGYETSPTYTMTGRKYANGFSLRYSNCFAMFNLNGQYDTLSFDVGHIDGKDMYKGQSIEIYLDGELAFSLDLDPEALVEHYEIPLHGALQMKIEGSYYAYAFAMVNVTVE